MKKNLLQAINLINEPLLLRKDVAESLPDLIATRLKGIEDINAFMFDDDDFGEKPKVSVKQGIGVVSIEGVITPRGDFWTWLFGGAPLEMIKGQICELLNDEEVDVIILDMDTPGGSIFGLEEFANFIFEAREQKTIYAISNHCACSAGYWIAASTHRVFASDASSLTGSIGVYSSHRSIQKALEIAGIKITDISSTEGKTVLSGNKDLSEEGEKILQEQVDHSMDRFVKAISQFRDKDEEEVRTKLGTGLAYYGQQAIDLGLVDEIQTLEQLVGNCKIGKDFNFMETLAKIDNLVQLEQQHPNFYSRVVKPGLEAETKTGEENGVKLERKRIQDIDDTTKEGHQKLAYDAKFGETTISANEFIVNQTKAEIKASKETPPPAATTTPTPKPNPTIPTYDPTKQGQDAGFEGATGGETDEAEKKARLSSYKSGVASAGTKTNPVAFAKTNA